MALVGEAGTAASAVATVLGDRGVEADGALEEARGHGVLVREGNGYRFRHPLLRSAVLELATPSEQREAHGALAAALPTGDRTRIWHLAESTVGTDPGVADELALVADEQPRSARTTRPRPPRSNAPPSSRPTRTWQRNGWPSLPTMPSSPETSHGCARWSTGCSRSVRSIGPRGEALFTLGLLEQYAGSVPRSVEYLDEASHLLEGVALVRCSHRARDGAFPAQRPGRVCRLRPPDRRGCGPRRPRAAADGAASRAVARWCSRVTSRRACARLAEVRRLADLPALRHDPRALLLMALAVELHREVGDAVDGRCRPAAGGPPAGRDRRTGPDAGDPGRRKAWLGDHAGAFADAGEAAELAGAPGLRRGRVGGGGDAGLAVGGARPARRRPASL